MRDRFVLPPEEIENIDAQNAAKHEQAKRDLEAMAAELGYESVSDLHALGLSQKQAQQLTWARTQNEHTIYFQATRQDGDAVKTVIRPQRGDFATDIFSPAYYQGHGGNHDFSSHEMKNNLKYALEGERYRSEKE